MGEVGSADVVFDPGGGGAQKPTHDVAPQGDDQGKGDDAQTGALNDAENFLPVDLCQTSGGGRF